MVTPRCDSTLHHLQELTNDFYPTSTDAFSVPILYPNLIAAERLFFFAH